MNRLHRNNNSLPSSVVLNQVLNHREVKSRNRDNEGNRTCIICVALQGRPVLFSPSVSLLWVVESVYSVCHVVCLEKTRQSKERESCLLFLFCCLGSKNFARNSRRTFSITRESLHQIHLHLVLQFQRRSKNKQHKILFVDSQQESIPKIFRRFLSKGLRIKSAFDGLDFLQRQGWEIFVSLHLLWHL